MSKIEIYVKPGLAGVASSIDKEGNGVFYFYKALPMPEEELKKLPVWEVGKLWRKELEKCPPFKNDKGQWVDKL